MVTSSLSGTKLGLGRASGLGLLLALTCQFVAVGCNSSDDDSANPCEKAAEKIESCGIQGLGTEDTSTCDEVDQCFAACAEKSSCEDLQAYEDALEVEDVMEIGRLQGETDFGACGSECLNNM